MTRRHFFPLEEHWTPAEKAYTTFGLVLMAILSLPVLPFAIPFVARERALRLKHGR